MANNPYVNKVVYGGNTLIDLSADTVLADKLLAGFTAHDAGGAPIVGTAAGGGLEYEEGTWTAGGNVAREFISFSKQHTSLPFMVYVCHVGPTYQVTNMTVARMFYFHIKDFFGTTEILPSTGVGPVCAVVWHQRRNTSTTLANGQTYVYYDSSDPGDTGSAYPRYWVTETGFYADANGGSSGYKWHPAHTYRWVAVWKPAA